MKQFDYKTNAEICDYARTKVPEIAKQYNLSDLDAYNLILEEWPTLSDGTLMNAESVRRQDERWNFSHQGKMIKKNRQLRLRRKR